MAQRISHPRSRLRSTRGRLKAEGEVALATDDEVAALSGVVAGAPIAELEGAWWLLKVGFGFARRKYRALWVFVTRNSCTEPVWRLDLEAGRAQARAEVYRIDERASGEPTEGALTCLVRALARMDIEPVFQSAGLSGQSDPRK